jgi:hypothetical protein
MLFDAPPAGGPIKARDCAVQLGTATGETRAAEQSWGQRLELYIIQLVKDEICST